MSLSMKYEMRFFVMTSTEVAAVHKRIVGGKVVRYEAARLIRDVSGGEKCVHGAGRRGGGGASI